MRSSLWTAKMDGRKEDLRVKWNSRLTAVALTGLIILALAYIASVEFTVARSNAKIIPGWMGILSNATITDSSIGKVTLSLSNGGMNLTITNSTTVNLNTFFGVNLMVIPHVNSSQFQFFDIWMKSNSTAIAGTISIQLDSGPSLTIIQKTYNTNEWHQEIVLLEPFKISPQNVIVNLMLGFKKLNIPSPSGAPAVEFSQPSFGYSEFTPQGF